MNAPEVEDAEDVDDCILGAAIMGHDFRDNGLRLFLDDGRVILCPGAAVFYVCTSKHLLQ